VSLQAKELSNIDYYDQNALEWAHSHGYGQKPYFEMNLRRFRWSLPTGRLLEIGSGFGGTAQWLTSRGYLYLGLEPAGGLREIAKKNNPGTPFLDMTAYDVSPHLGNFDGFVSMAVFVHLPKNRLAEVLRKVHGVLREDGMGLISVMEGDSDLEGQRPGRYYSLWQQKEFADELTNNGFTVENEARVSPGSSLSDWLVYQVIKQ
jgi:SAM-dependent methyltransferase